MEHLMSKEDLQEFCKAWDDAMVSNNAYQIGDYMAEDWVIVGTDS